MTKNAKKMTYEQAVQVFKNDMELYENFFECAYLNFDSWLADNNFYVEGDYEPEKTRPELL